MSKFKTLGNVSALNRRNLLKAGLGAVTLNAIGAPYVITSARAEQPLAGKKIGFSQSYATDEWLKIQREDIMTSAKSMALKSLLSTHVTAPNRKFAISKIWRFAVSML